MPNPPPSETSADDAVQDSTAIARQAILDSERAVFGYELFDRSIGAAVHTPASDAELLFNVLSHADNQLLVDRKTMFINCTHNSLAGGHLELIHPERVVLEIPPIAGDDPELIQSRLQNLLAVHKRGFRLAFNHLALEPAYASWLELAAFIKIDLSLLRPEAIAATILQARRQTGAQLIAEKVETGEQHSQLEALGIKLFQGYWFARPILVKGQTVRPGQATILQLINLVRKQASTTEIEDVLKRDPTLSFNLLRFINSAGFGLSCEVTSFRHAVMILGLKKLFRWAALLLATSRVGGVPPAVGNMAVLRGRLMELLAAELLTPEECDNAFVVGVFSLLDTMLGIPLARAVDAVSLPESVVDALLHRSGVLGPFLDLTEACENVDDAAFARAANALQLTNRQVNMAHLEALIWTETVLA